MYSERIPDNVMNHYTGTYIFPNHDSVTIEKKSATMVLKNRVGANVFLGPVSLNIFQRLIIVFILNF